VPRPTGPPELFVEQRDHEVTVDLVEAAFVDSEHGERFLRDAARDAASGADFREISCARKSRLAMRGVPRNGGRFLRRRLRPFQWKEFCGAVKDDEQVFRLVKFEAVDDAQSRERSGAVMSPARVVAPIKVK